MAPLKGWSARDYILAALGGCLAATAIVIIISVVLSPGRIVFSITHATKSNGNGGEDLMLTILANNTSHRAKVQYLSFYVVVANGTIFSADARVINDTFLQHRPPPELGTRQIKASLHTVEGDAMMKAWLDSNAGLTVLLSAQVRFHVGIAPTKIYDIKVSCPRVIVASVEGKTIPPQAQPAVPCM